jgi:HlyD family secretion protein
MTSNTLIKLPQVNLNWKWWRLGLPIGLTVLLFGVRPVLLGNQRSQDQWVTQAVERQTLPMTITANGTIKASRSINLSPKSAGIIQSLLVKEGDRVRQGQVLAVMDDSNLRGQLTQMRGQLMQQEANLQRLQSGSRPEDIAKVQAQLAEAEANLRQLQTGNRPQEIAQASAQLQQAQATLKLRETDVQRHQQLYDQGAIARQTLDQKIADRDVARMQVATAEQSLSLQNAGARPEQIDQAEARVAQQAQALAALQAGSRSEEIAQAAAQVESARGSLQTVAAQMQDLQVVAPFDGVVLQVGTNVGSFVSPSAMGGSGASSTSILTLAGDRNQVTTNVSESQIRNIKSGQTVMVKADAFPGETFEGKVVSVAPQASISQNVTSFEVKIDLTSANNSQLKAGMNVEANFEIGKREGALWVPNAAVVRQEEGQGVYVLGGDRKPLFQKIETGITSQGKTEVKSGLQGSEQVLVSPPPEQKKAKGIGFPPAPPQ